MAQEVIWNVYDDTSECPPLLRSGVEFENFIYQYLEFNCPLKLKGPVTGKLESLSKIKPLAKIRAGESWNRKIYTIRCDLEKGIQKSLGTHRRKGKS